MNTTNFSKWLSLGAACFSLISIPLNCFAADGSIDINLSPIVDGLTSPVLFEPLGTSDANLVGDQIGIIYIISKEGKKSEQPFLDLTSKLTKLNTPTFDERGVIGLALHPKFADNGKFYVVYSAPLRNAELKAKEWDSTLTLSEFKVKGDNKLQGDIASEKILLQIDKPYFNHNGGCIAFGPDGYLYFSVGDGGNAHDTGRGHSEQGNGQDTSNLLGKMLRIDVDKGAPYTVPSDNPFADGKKGRAEIYAYGLRNTWKFSFDKGGTHQLFGADVGQDLYEEVNIIIKGGNYGWRIREGFHCFDPNSPTKSPENCPTTAPDGSALIDPILEYKHPKMSGGDTEPVGISITGGYVYRGKAIPQLAGKYVFADWSKNRVKGQGVIYAATAPKGATGKRWTLEQVNVASSTNGLVEGYIVSLGQDGEGELYIGTTKAGALLPNGGKLFKITAK